MFLSVDLTALPEVVRQRMHELLTDENAVAAQQAKIRQQVIAKWYHDHPPASRDGFGGMEMAMDPYWVNYWRWKLGTERFTQDLDVKQWLKKKYPIFSVRHTGTRLQVGYGAPCTARFKKSYGESARPDGRRGNPKSEIRNPK